MELSSDTIKGLFGLGGAIIGAGIGALIKGYFDTRNRERKEITVWVEPTTLLVSMDASIGKKVEMSYESKKVTSLASTMIQVTNTGNRAIQDLEVNVAIEGDAELIAIGTSEMVESRCVHSVELQPKQAVLRAGFINPGEVIATRLISSGHEFTSRATFRQIDVKFIERIETAPNWTRVSLTALMLGIDSSHLLGVYLKLFYPQFREQLHKLARRQDLLP